MSRNHHLPFKIIVALICAILLGVFIFFNARLFIKGPQIMVTGPQNGSSFSDPFIELTGQATNAAFLSLDDRPIFIDESGHFNEKLLLSPGVSIIKLYARDKFNREETVLLQYVYNGTTTERNALPVPDMDAATSTESASTTDDMTTEAELEENLNGN